jgi:hypothetical protein
MSMGAAVVSTGNAGVITTEALEKLRALIGRELKINAAPHLTEVTADAVRHWAYRIGDRNPLWSVMFAMAWGGAFFFVLMASLGTTTSSIRASSGPRPGGA